MVESMTMTRFHGSYIILQATDARGQLHSTKKYYFIINDMTSQSHRTDTYRLDNEII